MFERVGAVNGSKTGSASNGMTAESGTVISKLGDHCDIPEVHCGRAPRTKTSQGVRATRPPKPMTRRTRQQHRLCRRAQTAALILQGCATSTRNPKPLATSSQSKDTVPAASHSPDAVKPAPNDGAAFGARRRGAVT